MSSATTNNAVGDPAGKNYLVWYYTVSQNYRVPNPRAISFQYLCFNLIRILSFSVFERQQSIHLEGEGSVVL